MESSLDSGSMTALTEQMGHAQANIDTLFSFRLEGCEEIVCWDTTTHGAHSEMEGLAQYLSVNKDDEDIPKDDVLTLVQDAQEKSYGLIVVGEKDVAVLDPDGKVDSVFRGEIAVENLDQVKPLDEVLRQRILQLTPFFSEEYERGIMQRIPSCTSGRWHPAFTDITAKGADKGEGIRTLAAHLGLDIQNTIAFGDGGNDISMIKAAGIGIAMGNALESLKQEADYITTTVDDDGVLNALRHFGLV